MLYAVMLKTQTFAAIVQMHKSGLRHAAIFHADAQKAHRPNGLWRGARFARAKLADQETVARPELTVPVRLPSVKCN